MSDNLKTGDTVEWKTPQGKTSGTIKKKLTAPIEIKGHHVAASKENPEFLVETEQSGKQSAHKPESLIKARHLSSIDSCHSQKMVSDTSSG